MRSKAAKSGIRVPLTVLDDEDVPLLQDIKKRKDIKRSLVGRRLSSLGFPSNLDDVIEEGEEEEEGKENDDGDALQMFGKYRRMGLEERKTIRGRFSMSEKLGGRDIFGFRTPVKRNQMADRVSSELQSRLLSTPPFRSSAASPSKIAMTPSKRGGQTPKSSSKVKDTPHSFRKRVSKRIDNIQHSEDDEDDEDDEDEDEDESSESSDNSDNEDIVKKNVLGTPEPRPFKTNHPPSTPSLTPRRRTRKMIDTKETADGYFEAHGQNSRTSDRTLNRLKTPRLTQEAMHSLLSNKKIKYEKEIEDLNSFHRTRFSKWSLLLAEDFNIVTFGLGSKRRLLQEFQDRYADKDDCLVVNGFFPSLTLKQILNGIAEEILDDTDSPFTGGGGIPELAEFILSRLKRPLYLIIHNIDGPNLRSDKVQTVLAQLAAHRLVRLICSIDHLNAPLIWDQKKLSKFNFVWYDATSFLPYSFETMNENSLMVQRSESLALNSLAAVFASLTPNAKGIFLLIAEYQLDSREDETSDEDNFAGIAFSDLYRRCREAFLVNSDITLRAQLTEFKDHKLIRIKKGHDGADRLFVPLNSSALKEFVDERRE